MSTKWRVPGDAYGKYSNKPTEVDGHVFPSKREAARYKELKLMERAGVISGLELQARYPLEVNGKLVCTYVADFRYTEVGAVVVEDCKGCRTDVYKLKRKLMLAVYDIAIRET